MSSREVEEANSTTSVLLTWLLLCEGFSKFVLWWVLTELKYIRVSKVSAALCRCLQLRIATSLEASKQIFTSMQRCWGHLRGVLKGI